MIISKRACINCLHWDHLTDAGHSRVHPRCERTNAHATAESTCDNFDPFTGDENDPLVSGIPLDKAVELYRASA